MEHHGKILPKGHRDRMLPRMAEAFAALGYRRATTAELARRCSVQENVLYRVWPTKKEMFLAAIDYVFESSVETWQELAASGDRATAAERILEYESVHHGEFGLYRIVFAGLSESEDPDIRRGMAEMYRRFHQFIVEQIGGQAPDPDLVAWAIVGLATMSNISRELGLMKEAERRAMFEKIGRVMIGRNT